MSGSKKISFPCLSSVSMSISGRSFCRLMIWVSVRIDAFLLNLPQDLAHEGRFISASVLIICSLGAGTAVLVLRLDAIAIAPVAAAAANASLRLDNANLRRVRGPRPLPQVVDAPCGAKDVQGSFIHP